jgi:hypothetical protein
VTSFAKKLSLVLTMDVNNLPKQLINVIALKLSGSVGHPLFLVDLTCGKNFNLVILKESVLK